MVQLTRALALELAFKGVRVNAIAPGFVVTEINDEYLKGNGREMTRNIPVGRFGETRDLDGALLLLASDAGASWPARPSWSTADRSLAISGA